MIIRGLTKENLTKDRIFLFILCYIHNLNFNSILDIYEVSHTLFWTYMDVLSPIIKLSTRQIYIMKSSAERLNATLLNKKINDKEVKLSKSESSMLAILKLYIMDIFTDGTKCVSLNQILNKCIACKIHNIKNFKEILITDNIIDSIDVISYKNSMCYRDSKINYIMEKYY